MKNLIFYIAALSATAAFVLVRNQVNNAQTRRPAPVEELAHKLEDAWADHHTVA